MLALLFVFGDKVDGFTVGVVSHGVAVADDANFSESEERENGVDQCGYCGQREGRDGRRSPARIVGSVNVEIINYIEEAENASGEARPGQQVLAF